MSGQLEVKSGESVVVSSEKKSENRTALNKTQQLSKVLLQAAVPAQNGENHNKINESSKKVYENDESKDENSQVVASSPGTAVSQAERAYNTLKLMIKNKLSESLYQCQVGLAEKDKPTIFVSYSWGPNEEEIDDEAGKKTCQENNKKHRESVERLALLLRATGLTVLRDCDNAVFVPGFTQRVSDDNVTVVLIGDESLKTKGERGCFYWFKSEPDDAVKASLKDTMDVLVYNKAKKYVACYYNFKKKELQEKLILDQSCLGKLAILSSQIKQEKLLVSPELRKSLCPIIEPFGKGREYPHYVSEELSYMFDRKEKIGDFDWLIPVPFCGDETNVFPNHIAGRKTRLNGKASNFGDSLTQVLAFHPDNLGEYKHFFNILKRALSSSIDNKEHKDTIEKQLKELESIMEALFCVLKNEGLSEEHKRILEQEKDAVICTPLGQQYFQSQFLESVKEGYKARGLKPFMCVNSVEFSEALPFRFNATSKAPFEETAKEDICLKDMFDKPHNRRIWINGKSGSGKSTLSHYICHEWATEELWTGRYDLVLRIPLKNLVGFKGDIGSFIYNIAKEFDSSYSLEFITNYIRSKTDRLLFLLDGYNEVNQDHPVVRELLGLPNIIVLSQPGAVRNTLFDNELRLSAPRMSDLKAYALQYFHDNKQHLPAVKEILLQPGCMTFTQTPLLFHLLCFLRGHDLSLDFEKINESSLYRSLVAVLLDRSKVLDEEKSEEISQDILLEVLSHLAMQLDDGKSACFSEQDVRDILTKKGCDTKANMPALIQFFSLESQSSQSKYRLYSFLHETLQDYFSAYSYTLSLRPLPCIETMKPQVVRFLAAQKQQGSANNPVITLLFQSQKQLACPADVYLLVSTMEQIFWGNKAQSQAVIDLISRGLVSLKNSQDSLLLFWENICKRAPQAIKAQMFDGMLEGYRGQHYYPELLGIALRYSPGNQVLIGRLKDAMGGAQSRQAVRSIGYFLSVELEHHNPLMFSELVSLYSPSGPYSDIRDVFHAHLQRRYFFPHEVVDPWLLSTMCGEIYKGNDLPFDVMASIFEDYCRDYHVYSKDVPPKNLEAMLRDGKFLIEEDKKQKDKKQKDKKQKDKKQYAIIFLDSSGDRRTIRLKKQWLKDVLKVVGDDRWKNGKDTPTDLHLRLEVLVSKKASIGVSPRLLLCRTFVRALKVWCQQGSAQKESVFAPLSHAPLSHAPYHDCLIDLCKCIDNYRPANQHSGKQSVQKQIKNYVDKIKIDPNEYALYFKCSPKARQSILTWMNQADGSHIASIILNSLLHAASHGEMQLHVSELKATFIRRLAREDDFAINKVFALFKAEHQPEIMSLLASSLPSETLRERIVDSVKSVMPGVSWTPDLFSRYCNEFHDIFSHNQEVFNIFIDCVFKHYHEPARQAAVGRSISIRADEIIVSHKDHEDLTILYTRVPLSMWIRQFFVALPGVKKSPVYQACFRRALICQGGRLIWHTKEKQLTIIDSKSSRPQNLPMSQEDYQRLQSFLRQCVLFSVTRMPLVSSSPATFFPRQSLLLASANEDEKVDDVEVLQERAMLLKVIKVQMQALLGQLSPREGVLLLQQLQEQLQEQLQADSIEAPHNPSRKSKGL